jgi:hypothetical protein
MSKYPKWLGLSLFAFVLVVAGAVAQAQQPAKVPRIGFLANTEVGSTSIEPFRRGLQAAGYIEGKNIHHGRRCLGVTLDALAVNQSYASLRCFQTQIRWLSQNFCQFNTFPPNRRAL